MLKGALLGVGHVAVGGHLPGWRKRSDVTIVAAADARPERREHFAACYPEARWYDSAEELLGKEEADLDFVDICTQPSSHAPLVRAALARSLHVLCEKPLVLSPEELRGLPALASEKDRTLCTVHNWLRSPAISRMTALVRAGEIGEVRRARWETLRDKPAASVGSTNAGNPGDVAGAPNWRVDPAQSGGGILVDHGWHALYTIAAWMGEPPARVAARLEIRKHSQWPVEDTATVILAYPSATAEIFLTWTAPSRANRIELEGTLGLLRLEGSRLSLERETAPTETWEVPSLTEGSHHPDWFGGVIDDFLGEIADSRARGRNLAQAALCVQVLALARESSRRAGGPLGLSRMAGVPGA
ncbi:MAG TPA: Gfo/Idh/MocA family oxidoreductase [Thermoanaerobaculia bacterium]|jgi:predicted dehydrogenase